MNCRHLLSKDEKAFLKERFADWKEQHNINTGADSSGTMTLGQHPTIRIAFARLINDHGYGLVDVAMMLGISDERVRQIVRAHGITVGVGARKRYWDDDAGRFVTITNGTQGNIRRIAEVRHRAKERRRAKNLRLDTYAWVLRDLHADLGRIPNLADLSEALGMTSAAVVQNAIAGSSGNRARKTDALWHRAGFSRRPRYSSYIRGRNGHHG